MLQARLTDPTTRCPHTTMCPHTIKYASFYYMFVVVLLYICALNNECFCGYFGFSGATRRPQYLAASYHYLCVRILVYILWSHTTMYVSSYY
jgi:hypothetical protein